MNNIPIVYENDDIYIINKHSGLATQGGKGILHSVDTILEKQVGQKVYLVHRLDKDTEGLLVVAKNPKAAHKWTDLIAGKEIQKEYYALCVGEFAEKKGLIDEPITHKGATKHALTQYTVEEIFTINYTQEDKEEELPLSLVRLVLKTGRMHQIRIHLAKNGTPIAGDDKYGDFKFNKILKKHHGIKKLHLAAIQLSIPEKLLNSTSTSTKNKTLCIQMPTYMQKSCKMRVKSIDRIKNNVHSV